MAVEPSRFCKKDRIYDELFGAGTVIRHEVISEIVSIKFDVGVQCYYERADQHELEFLTVVEAGTARREAPTRPRARLSSLAESR